MGDNRLSDKWYYVIWSTLILAFILILADNIKRAYFHCFNPMDFSVYQQAIYELSRFKEWNPYISIRELRIFEDHFDPIIYLPAIFSRIFGRSSYFLLIFEWLFLLYTFIAYKKLGPKKSHKELILAAVFILFSRGLIKAFEFPIHSTTLSILPAILFFYYFSKNNLKGMAINALILMLCREIYPIMVLSFSFIFLLKKDYRKFLVIGFIGLVGTFFIMWARPRLMPVVDYAHESLSRFLADPFGVFYYQATHFKYPWKSFVFFIIPAFYFFKHEKKRLIELLGAFFFIAPLAFSHILTGSFYHHHGLVFMGPFLSLILFSGFFNWILKDKRILISALILTIAPAISSYKKMAKFTLLNDHPSCEISMSKKDASKVLYKFVSQIPLDQTIMSTGGLTQALMEPGRLIYIIMDYRLIRDQYDYLVLEKNSNGETWPLSKEQIETIMNRCKPMASQITQDDEYFLLMKGPFTEDCIGQKEIYPTRSSRYSKWIK